jgi:hypothetical protein
MRPIPAVVVLLTSLAASPANAQIRESLHEWPPVLEVGHRATIVVDRGVEVESTGTIVEISIDGVRVRQGAGLQNIHIDDILRIETRDSLWNGTVTGAIVGAVGAGAGLSLDVLIDRRRTIYVAPILSHASPRSSRALGVRFSVSW